MCHSQIKRNKVRVQRSLTKCASKLYKNNCTAVQCFTMPLTKSESNQTYVNGRFRSATATCMESKVKLLLQLFLSIFTKCVYYFFKCLNCDYLMASTCYWSQQLSYKKRKMKIELMDIYYITKLYRSPFYWKVVKEQDYYCLEIINARRYATLE